MRLARFVCLPMILLAMGCGDDSNSSTGSKSNASAEIKGQILIAGSSTVEPISNQAKMGFNAEYSNVTIDVSGDGTSNGFKAFQVGETDISDASRPIKKKELDACNENKVQFVEIPVAYDGLTFVINKDNDFVSELTIEQLQKIFVEGGAKTWKEVNDAWPDEQIAVYMPGVQSGTYDYAFEILAKKSKLKLRNDNDIVTMSEQDNILVDGVSKNKMGIGFFGFAYYENNKDTLKAVRIVNPESSKAIEPTMETIESGEYAPFSRPLFIYVNLESMQKLQVSRFVNYYLDNAKTLAEAAKYVALPPKLYEAARKNLEEEVTGTHFLTKEGELREGSLTEVFKPENVTK